MGRLIVSLLLGGALFALIAWQMGLIPTSTEPRSAVTQQGDVPDEKRLELGDFLYPPLPIQEVKEAAPTAKGSDPVVILGHMTVLDTQNVPAQVPGRLLFIGEEVPEGMVQAAGMASFIAEPFDYTKINQGEREVVKVYRRFYKGEIVHSNQMVAMVDPSKALGDLEMKRSKVLAAEAERDAAIATAKEGQNRYEIDLRLFEKGAIGRQDLNTSYLTKVKLHFDAVSKEEGVKLAKTEEHVAHIIYKQHEVRNKTSLQRCFIETMYKQGGEAVKELEPVLQLNSLDRLLAEALVEIQYLPRIKGAKRVRIEPTQDQDPRKTLHGHRGPITAVAVTEDPVEPLILSASEDRTVCIWKKTSIGPERELRHPEPVRALAYVKRAAEQGVPKHLALAGCADGSLYLWDVHTQDHKPLQLAKQAHAEAITAVAFSPDGKFCASGSADGTIKLWQTDTLKEWYAFDREHGADNPHQDAITGLAFTPQSKLVSTSRDRTVRVWVLKQKGVELAYDPIGGRTGGVGSLGVSQDGRWLLFDYGKTLQVRAVKDGKLVNTLQNPGGAIPFETLAIFSPDASLLLTAGASEGRLQLWKAPSGAERAFEVRQFATLERGQVTCAAFSSQAGKPGDNSFAVSGTKDGFVYIWTVPTTKEVESHPIENVRVRLVTNILDPTTRQMKIAVDVPNPPTPQNPNGRLIPGRPVTIVID